MNRHSIARLVMFFMVAGLVLGAQAAPKSPPENKVPHWSGRILLSAGMNLPSLSFSGNFTGLSRKNRPGLLVSLALLLRISDHIWFSPGARLEKRNAAISVSGEDGAMAADYKTTLLAFPLALVVKPFSRSSSLFFQAGLEGNWLLLNRVVPDGAGDPYQDLLPDSRRTYLAPFFGAGYVFELERGSLVLQACFSLKGAKFYKEMEAGEEYSLRSSAFFISIGYAIRAF